jgi:hypothetical protein
VALSGELALEEASNTGYVIIIIIIIIIITADIDALVVVVISGVFSRNYYLNTEPK